MPRNRNIHTKWNGLTEKGGATRIKKNKRRVYANFLSGLLLSLLMVLMLVRPKLPPSTAENDGTTMEKVVSQAEAGTRHSNSPVNGTFDKSATALTDSKKKNQAFDVGFDITLDGHKLQVELANILFELCAKAHISVRFRGREFQCDKPRCVSTTETIWVPVVVGRSKTAKLKPGTFIIWNLDQPRPTKGDQFVGALRVWEFSKHAADIRKSENIPNSVLPFLFYTSSKLSIPANPTILLDEKQNRDIPVCLLGAESKRRNAVVEALRASGIKVHYTQSAWGDEKIKLLLRCHLILNIHFYTHSVQEVLRILEGISHGAAVVSESASLPTENDALLEGHAVHFVPYDATDGHVESMKQEVIKQLEVLRKSSADDLLAMRKDSNRLLDEWMQRAMLALQKESDELLEKLLSHRL